LYLDDDDAVTHVLEKRLVEAGFITLRVYGAGKSGDRSYDHVAMVVHRLVHLDPDVVIVFAGVNDLMAGINDADYLLLPFHSAEIDPDWSAFEALTLLATELQLARLAYAALKPHKYRSLVEEVSWVSHYRELVELRKKLPLASELPVLDPGAYAQNLVTLAGVARAHGFKLVLMTQATTWNSAIDDAAEDWQWMNAGGTAALTGDGTMAFPADWMDASMESYNDVMRDVAARHGVPLFDLAAEMPKSLEFFYDDVHFNIQGAERAGTKLGEFLEHAVLHEDATSSTASDSLAMIPSRPGTW
jgi:lysophospholipase L1-like esterase